MNRLLDFSTFYQQWWDVALGEARRVALSDAAAEDAAQVVFVRLFESGKWRDIQSPERFVRRAAKNEALNQVQRQARLFGLTPEMAETLVSPERLPDALLLRSERRAALWRIINRLPPRCRLATMLVLLHGYSHRDAAAELGISVGAVEKQVARSRRYLRAMFAAGLIDAPFFASHGGE